MPANAKRKSDQKRDNAHSTRREKEMRELWFNPHATEMCESRMDICLCGRDCHMRQNENVQRELQKLANKYAHKCTAGMEDEEEIEIKTKAKAKAKASGEANEQDEATKDFLCFEKSSATRSRSKQREGKEQSKNVHEKSRSCSCNRPSPVNRRFKTREEAKRYRELKAIYTTKPEESVATARQNENETKSNRKKEKDECRGQCKKKYAASSSAESVTMAVQRPHRATKPVARPHVCNDCGYPRYCSNAPLYMDEREHQKENDRETEVGCCGMCKKSKADKQQCEYEAYTPAKCPTKHTRRPNRDARATYTREPKPAPPPPPDITRDKGTGGCGSCSKKKQQHSEADLYEQYRSFECSCGDNYPKEFEPHPSMEEHASKHFTQTTGSKCKRCNRAPEQKISETVVAANLHKQPKYTTREKVPPPVPQKYAPRKTKSVESNAKHTKKLDKTKSDSTVYASKRKPHSVKGTKNKNASKDDDTEKASHCSCLCQKQQTTKTEKPETKTKTNKKRKKPPAAVSFSEVKNEKVKRQASQPIERERVKVNRHKQPAFHPKPEPKPEPTSKNRRYPTKYKPQTVDGIKTRRRNQPAFHPKPESRPAAKTSSSSVHHRTPSDDKRRATANAKIRSQKQAKKAKSLFKQADKGSLKKDDGSETSYCPCLKKQKNFKDSNISEKGRGKKTDKPKTYVGTKRRPSKDKRREKIQTEKSTKLQRKPSQIRSQEKVQREKPKQQASKANSREKLEKKPSETSCWSCFRSDKTKKSDKAKKEPSKRKSADKMHSQRPKDDSKQKLSKTKSKEKFIKKKSTKPKSQEKIERKSSRTSCWSCHSNDKKEKTKKSDQSKTRTKSQQKSQSKPIAKGAAKVHNDKPKKIGDSKQRPSTVKSQEKVQKKTSETSCMSCSSKKGKDKRKPSITKSQDRVQSKSQDKIQKDKSKKTTVSKKPPSKARSQEKRPKTQKEKPTDPKKTPSKARNQSSETSCWSCRSSCGKDKPKKPDESKNKPSKSKCEDKVKKEKPKKPTDPKKTTSKPRNQEKVKNQSSETSCWSCRSSGAKDKTKKPSKSKSRDKVQKSKSKELAQSKCTCHDKVLSNRIRKLIKPNERATKSKSQEKVHAQSSKTSCWSCRSTSEPHKSTKSDATHKVSRSKTQLSKAKGKENVQKKTSGTSCCSKNTYETDDSKSKDSKSKQNEDVQKQPTRKYCLFLRGPKKEKYKDKTSHASPAREDQAKTKKTKIAKGKKVEKTQLTETSCSSSCCKSSKGKGRSSLRGLVMKTETVAVDERAVKTKHEDMSYCKAVYQELEHIIMQQKQCPIMISQTRINKTPEAKTSQTSPKSKQKEEKTKQNTKAKQANKQNATKCIQNQKSKQRNRTQVPCEKSDSDLDLEKAYMPEYVLGKQQRTGDVIARARKVRYSLLPSVKARKKFYRKYYKECRHVVDFQI